MTSKLKCPVCSAELSKIDDTFFMACPDCDKLLIGTPQLWQALIQAKQDLEIATKALKDARIFASTHCIASAVKTIDKAIEQIDHFADASKMVEHKE